MKHLLIPLTLFVTYSSSLSAQANLPRTPQQNTDRSPYLANLTRLYKSQKQSQQFLEKRVDLARKGGLFQLWRSFPPYYYDITNRFPDPLTSKRIGLCAGDAHIENFGFIHMEDDQKKIPVFTLNDLDDASLCSLNADAMRLYISHKLIGTQMSAETFLREYQKGLLGNDECKGPSFIQDLKRKSLSKGKEVNEDYLAGCPSDETLLSVQESKDLEKFHNEISADSKEDKEFSFACKNTKLTGGSAGEERFTVVLRSKRNRTVTDAYELKPLVRPAPLTVTMPGPPLTNEARKTIYNDAIGHFYSRDAKKYFSTHIYKNKIYQKRPHWEGNKGVKLSKIPHKEKEGVMLFQSCILGTLHKKNPESFKVTFDPNRWEERAQFIISKFTEEFEMGGGH